MKKILICANDAGGGNAVLPVIREITKDNNFNVLSMAGGPTKGIFNRDKIKFVDADKLNDSELITMAKDFKPDIFLSGTSGGIAFDKKILLSLRGSGTKSIYIFDYWAHYREIFSSVGQIDIKYLPNIICVMDGRAKNEMVAEGTTSDIIKITGNPHFDNFQKKIRSGVNNKNNILFISQPHEYQFEVLNDVLEALEKFSTNYYLIIRPHPKEDYHKFNSYIAVGKIKIDHSSTIEDLISYAGLIIGMDSMVLFQSAVFGKKVISYRSKLEIGGRLANNRSELEDLISQYFNGSFMLPKNSFEGIIIPNATDNVIKVIKKL